MQFINKGVLPDFLLREMVEKGEIGGDRKIADSQVQPSSIDLRIGRKAFRIRSSFLPQGFTVREKLSDLKMYEIDLTNGGILEKGNVYLIPLFEKLKFPKNISGRTNPKSSTGRLDIFTRVITDRSYRFEDVAEGYSGRLYLEVVPKSFTIRLTTGQSLNQLRVYGNKKNKTKNVVNDDDKKVSDSELYRYYSKIPLLFDENDKEIPINNIKINNGLFMGINLIGCEKNIIGYKAKKNSAVIDIKNVNHYKLIEYWEPIYSSDDNYLILEPEEFYIFSSKEKVSVPIDMAAEMVEFDSGSGELRTHYAGFFDSGFGYGRDGSIKGTKAVLEVRPHDVPFRVEDGQVFCKLKYEWMLKKPLSFYGSGIGSHYHNQGLKLSKHFK